MHRYANKNQGRTSTHLLNISVDWTGAQIGNNDCKLSALLSRNLAEGDKIGSDDIKNVDLTAIHNLSGPIAVEGAEPGDCLVVDILDGSSMATSYSATR